MLDLITKTIAADDLDKEVNSLFQGIGGTEASLESVVNYINTVIRVATSLAGIIALFMVFYSTILYVTNYGDDAKIETAKKTLLWSIIGLLFIAATKFIVYILEDAIN